MAQLTQPVNKIISTISKKELANMSKVRSLSAPTKSNESLMQQRAKMYREALKKK